MSIRIGSRLVGFGHRTFIIAEIGINHNGSLEIAKQLIDVAVDAGCDAVKFQKRTVHVVYTPEELAKERAVDRSIIENGLARTRADGREWKVFPNLDDVERLRDPKAKTTNSDLKYALEFGEREFDEIDLYCKQKGIMWSASSWDGLSAHVINGFNPAFHKIASACLTHADLLRRVCENKKPVILSTGGSTLEQIQRAVNILSTEDLIILHCVANYPCLDDEVNLGVMQVLANIFPGVPVGYSGHERDILPSVLAVACGACVIERHITLSKTMPGSDHAASLEPSQLVELVMNIRRAEALRGDALKRVLPSEVPVMAKLRRKDTLFQKE